MASNPSDGAPAALPASLTRPWALGALAALAGFVLHLLLPEPSPDHAPGPWLFASASAVFTMTMAFLFTIGPVRPVWSGLFALGSGGFAFAFVLMHGLPRSNWSGGEWRVTCLILFLAIATTCFQAARDAGRWSTDYPTLHRHAWWNALAGAVAHVLVGATLLIAVLLAALFNLIGIDVLWNLLGERIVLMPLLFGAFGAALALLRERAGIVDALQRAATSILAILAVPMGLGMVVFLLALPVTGLEPLWEATQAPTPIMLACVILGLLLVNCVVGQDDTVQTDSRLLLGGAAAIAVALLPFAAIAFASSTTRIAQHGLSPDRLWAMLFIGFAMLYGAGYLAALLWGRTRWWRALRQVNTALALTVLTAFALLATPLLSFEAWATRDQVARLTTGRVAPADFDWQALRFDFGAPGVRALEQLAEQTPWAEFATRALALESRYGRRGVEAKFALTASAGTDITTGFRTAVRTSLGSDACSSDRPCIAHGLDDGRVLVFESRNRTVRMTPFMRPPDAPWQRAPMGVESQSFIVFKSDAEAAAFRTQLLDGGFALRPETHLRPVVGNRELPYLLPAASASAATVPSSDP